MPEFWHKGIRVSGNSLEGYSIYASVHRPSWVRMDAAGWPANQIDGFVRQTDKECDEALRAYQNA